MGNEAFARVVIDTQLKDRGWNVHDQNSVRYEYVLPAAHGLIMCCATATVGR